MFTGQLGTPESKLGYIVLGAAGTPALTVAARTPLRITVDVRSLVKVTVPGG